MFSSEYSSQDSTKLLQSEEIDVWHFHSNAVELCTIMNNDELEDRYHLYNCTATKQLVELVNLENVKERYGMCMLNMHSILHVFLLGRKWPEHSINLRATSATSNQNNSNSKSADSVLSEDWFTSNVRSINVLAYMHVVCVYTYIYLISTISVK